MTTTTPLSRNASSPAPSGRGRGGWWSKLDTRISPYLYISPFALLFLITGLVPLIYTFWVSFHDWNLLMGQGDFVGLDNFTAELGGTSFWKALVNTISIFLLSSVPQVILSLGIAALLDNKLRGATFWRMGVLLPYVVAPVAVALIFGNLFGDRFGLINTILGQVGIDPIAWHSDRLASHVAIATMVNFRWVGYNALIFLAAMQAIPRDLYEAAAIDGAGLWRRFRSITIPSLRPTLIFVIITSTIGGLQIFDEPSMYDNVGRGGSDGQWKTLTVYLYEMGWTNANFGRASAVAVLLFFLVVTLGIVNFAISRRISSEDSR